MRLVVSIVLSFPMMFAFVAGTATAANSLPTGAQRINVSNYLQGLYPDDPGIAAYTCKPGFEIDDNRATSDAGPSRGRTRTRADGTLEKLWEMQCINTTTKKIDPFSLEIFYVAAPTPDDLVEDLYVLIPGYLASPQVAWPSMDPEFGWLYVNAPMDYRILNLAPVSVAGTVTNELGSVSASMSATPTSVTLEPGDTGSPAHACSFADAQAGYSHAVPGACSYKYQNSSAISANGRTFDVTVTVDWPIVSDPPQTPPSLQTFSTSPVAVAEVQSLVTCIGSQGEC